MTRAKAKTYVRVDRHHEDRRKWAVEFKVGVQGFTLDCGAPLTKHEAQWWVDQFALALCNLKP